MNRFMFVVLMLCLAFATPSFAGPSSLPENGDFETVDSSKTARVEIRNTELAEKLGGLYQNTNTPLIKNCDLVTFGMPAKVSIDKDVKVSGSQSVRLDCKKGEQMRLVINMPAKPMQLYKITVWVKRTSESPDTEVILSIWSNKKSCGFTNYKNLSGATEKKNGFSKMEYVFSSKEEAEVLWFYLGACNFKLDDTLTVWFDDIKVEEVKE